MAFGIDDILAIGSSVFEIVKRFVPDPELAQKISLEIQQLLSKRNSEQAAINQEYAKSSSIFLAGPRQFLFWVLGFGAAYHIVMRPLLSDLLVIFGIKVQLPGLDIKPVLQLLLGMLGLGM